MSSLHDWLKKNYQCQTFVIIIYSHWIGHRIDHKICHWFGHKIGHRFGHKIGHRFDHRIGHNTSVTSKITINVFGH